MNTVLSSLQELQRAVSAAVFAAAVWIGGGPRPVIGPASPAERELHRSSLQAARSVRDADVLSDVLAIGDAFGAIEHAATAGIVDRSHPVPGTNLPALDARITAVLEPAGAGTSSALRAPAVLLVLATEVGLRALATGDSGLAVTATALTGQARQQALTVAVGPDNAGAWHCLVDLLDHLDTAIALAGSSPDLVRAALAPVTTPVSVVTGPDPIPPGGIPVATADAAGVWRVPADDADPVVLVFEPVAPQISRRRS